MNHIIEIQHLCKSFGAVKAVQDISFHVKKGELFAFLGVNGAGKSTTIHMLCGQLPQDSGTILVRGKPLETHAEEVKRSIGVVFQNSALDQALSVRDNLESRAALYGITGRAFQTRLRDLADMLSFGDLLPRAVGKLSGGQRRRIDIARALVHFPDILILDEPTTGLDPQTRQLLWHVVETLRKQNQLTVFLTTHYMEEAAEADYIVILDGGRIAADGTPLQLKNTYTQDFITLYGVTESAVKQLSLPYEPLRDAYRLAVENTADATKLILQFPSLFQDYEITKGKMDDVFLAVTGKNLTGGSDT